MDANLTRVWKDPEYRASLSAADLAALPAHPAGAVELSEIDLEAVDAASATITVTIPITFELGCFTFNSTNCSSPA